MPFADLARFVATRAPRNSDISPFYGITPKRSRCGTAIASM